MLEQLGFEPPSVRQERLARQEAERIAEEKRKSEAAARKREEEAERERHLARLRQTRAVLLDRLLGARVVSIPDRVLNSRVSGRARPLCDNAFGDTSVRTILGNLLFLVEENAAARLGNWQKHRSLDQWSVDLRIGSNESSITRKAWNMLTGSDTVIVLHMDHFGGITFITADVDGERVPGSPVIEMLGLATE